jgi:hypothetical protein
MTVVSLQSKTRPIEAERPPMRLVASDAPDSLSGLDDNARFRSIVMPHIDEAYRLAHWLTGNRTDAEDVVQDASMRAFRAIRSYARRQCALLGVEHCAEYRLFMAPQESAGGRR